MHSNEILSRATGGVTCRVTGDGRSQIYPFLSPTVPSSGHIKWKTCGECVFHQWGIPGGLWGGWEQFLPPGKLGLVGLAEQLPAVPPKTWLGRVPPPEMMLFLSSSSLFPPWSCTALGCGPQGAATHLSPVPSLFPSCWLQRGQIQLSEGTDHPPSLDRAGGHFLTF